MLNIEYMLQTVQIVIEEYIKKKVSKDLIQIIIYHPVKTTNISKQYIIRLLGKDLYLISLLHISGCKISCQEVHLLY